MKIIIIGMLLLIVFSLGFALYTMVKDRGQSNRTVRTLGMRVGLSIGLILFVLLSYKLGLIKPNADPYTIDKANLLLKEHNADKEK